MASDAVHDINSLVSSKGRDFLIRNNGDQVKISSLVGKNVGLYFSASWCIPCCLFTPKLAKVYEPLASKSDFEVIFISSDRDENSFKEYFSKMPWLSIPFADLETKKSLKKLFNVNGIPHLVVLDAKGKVSTEEGVDLVVEYGVDAYPFTSQQIQSLIDKEAKKMNQTISSLLGSTSRSYILTNDGNQIPVSELEGKLIGLYFSMHGHKLCDEFTQKLIEAYKKLKEKGENFEIVLISLDDKDENLFKEAFKTMPWLALPFKDEKCQELKQYHEVSDIPSLVIIGTDGKTSNPNAVELIKEHGIDAYPFALKKIEGVDEVSNAKLESESPKPALVCGARDLDLEKNKGKVKVSCCSGEMSNTTRTVNVGYNPASHGTDGPLHVSYPLQTYPEVGAFIESATNVGIPASSDPNAGNNTGVFLATSNINPANATRSFSRTAYLDPVAARPNLSVLTGHTVTRVVFNSTQTDEAVASGVQFAASRGAAVSTVYARKEVVLCGGAVNDPQILQLSGIGDAALLDRVGVEQVVDLAGVGYHLQDHLSTGVVFSPSSGATMPPTRITGDAATDSYVNSAIAYVRGSTLFSEQQWSSLIDQMRQNRAASVEAYDAPAAVKAGYNATYTTQVETLFPTSIGPIELLFALSFGGVQVQAALQHPLSRGNITVTSTDAFTPPRIDPGYLSNDVDMTILRQGFKLARRLGSTSPLADFTSAETAPGSAVETDGQWDEWIRRTVGTEYHPSSTCSMLPRQLGGVVDARLKVYGTRNLRVIDAAVPPVSFSAHLMSVTYGLAEIGAEMVLSDYAAGMKSATNQAATGGSRGSSGSTGSSGSSGSTGSRGAAGSSGSSGATSGATRWTLTTAHAAAAIIATIALSLR